MSDRIRMNFDLMDEMARAFGEGAQVLEEVFAEVNAIASMLEDGALLGQAGEAFSAGCRGPLAGSISQLKNKFEELKTDIETAKQEMLAADAGSKGLY